jgi:hypothetical protein
MELLGDVGYVESHFSLFGDSVGVGARSARFVPNVPRLRNPFGPTQWYS